MVSTFIASASSPGGAERSEGIQAMRSRRVSPAAPGSQKIERSGCDACPFARAVRMSAIRSMHSPMGRRSSTSRRFKNRSGMAPEYTLLPLPHPRIEGELLGRQEADAREVRVQGVQEEVALT